MQTPKETWDLAGALLDGDPVDWSRFERAGDPERRTLIAALQSLARLAAASSSRGPKHGKVSPPHRPSLSAAAVVGIAALHILLGLMGFAAGYTGGSPVPSTGSAVVVIVFSASALWLFAGGRRDVRAWSLGGFYALVATAFARRFLGIVTGTPLDALVMGVFPDAFLPAFLWSFISRFPHVLRFSRVDRFCRVALRTSVAAGVVLFAVNLLLPYVASIPAHHLLHRAHSPGLYWLIVMALCAAALPAIIVRARLAPYDERRRVAFFCGAVVLTVSPVALEMFAEIAVPAFAAAMDRPTVRRIASFGVFASLLALPIATAYAVVVERVLDVRLVIGRALQYLLARGSLILISFVPFALLVTFGARNRQLTIGELFAGGTGAGVLSLAAAGMILLSTRHRLLSRVDRVFMRMAVDLAEELTRFAAQLGNTRSAAETLELAEDVIQRATGAEPVRVYLENDGNEAFAASRGVGEPLAYDCACAALLREDTSPLAVGSGERDTVWPLLPSYDGRWTASSGSAVLVPFARTGEALSGFISVGRKRSGLPFSSSELSFVSGVASAVALAVAQHSGGLQQPVIPDDDPARECVVCGRVASNVGMCACGQPTRVAAVPAILNGKFQVERRVGVGGMGVVYRAVDSTLDRPVALKTLSRLSASAAGRLAQEAKVMAAVVHPHLATIYGVERWRGTPVLIVEYCERGTLADRLHCDRLPITETLRLGSSLARALAELHSVRVLHRDVKPSNIGFLNSGAAKLLDFGIAIYATANAPPAPQEQTLASTQTQTIDTRGWTIAGTPLYISPDTLRGAEADARVDLWALTLVMYEALTGRHPFAAATVPEVLARVRRGRIPDVRESRPECPDALARAFGRWLARDAAQRPQTATDLAGDIEGLLERAG